MTARRYNHAMRLGTMLIACAMTLLTACGQGGLLEALRKPGAEPRQPEPEPDAKELVRVGVDTLFMNHPSAVAVSRPRRIADRGFSVCVTAIVGGKLNSDPQPVTLFVIIEHGKLSDRHRATSYDGCATESYEEVQIAPAPAQ
jgi:hypothetical protein